MNIAKLTCILHPSLVHIHLYSKDHHRQTFRDRTFLLLPRGSFHIIHSALVLHIKIYRQMSYIPVNWKLNVVRTFNLICNTHYLFGGNFVLQNENIAYLISHIHNYNIYYIIKIFINLPLKQKGALLLRTFLTASLLHGENF